MELDNYHQELRTKLNGNIANNEAIKLVKYYQSKALALENVRHQNYANYYLAEILYQKGELNRAASLLKQTKSFFSNENATEFLHRSYILLGKIKQQQGNVESTLAYLELAKKIDPENSYFKAARLLNLSIFLKEFHAYDEALEKLKLSLKLVSVHNENERVLYFDLLLQMATIYLQKKQASKTFAILTSIEKVILKHPCNEIYTKVLLGFASYYQYKNEIKRAVKYYQSALLESNNKQQMLQELSCKVALSTLYLEENNLLEAEKILLGTLNAYKQEDKVLYLSLLNNLYTLYNRLENEDAKEKFKEELDYNSDY